MLSSLLVLVHVLAARLRGWPILGFIQGGTINWVLAAILIYLTVIPLIVFVFLPKGRVYHQALEEASTRAEVTPRVKAAINDPLVRAARVYELLMIVALAWLMIAKPF